MDAVKSDDAVEQLEALAEELRGLRPDWGSAEFVSWEARTRSALTRALGAQHYITEQFIDTHWSSVSLDGALDARAFRDSAIRVQGMLDAAIAEVEMLGDDVPVADEEGIDAELWEEVAPEIRSESWVKVARNALIFTEDRIRKWAGRPESEVGAALAVAIFKAPQGNFQLGKTDGETEGWQLFAQGIAKALRNVDTHRIQERPDLKRYALGVVGACSLLLTQMRFEHGNRFRDTSPAASTETGDGSEQA
jgi:hypothetical protein